MQHCMHVNLQGMKSAQYTSVSQQHDLHLSLQQTHTVLRPFAAVALRRVTITTAEECCSCARGQASSLGFWQ